MMDTAGMAETSELISAELEGQLKPVLSKIEHGLELVCIGRPDDKNTVEMVSFLKHMAKLSDTLKPVFLMPGEDPEKDLACDAALLPATGLYRDGAFTGVVFHGIPGGQEINSFVLALYNAGGPGQKLDDKLLQKIRKYKKRADIRIFVSLSCHHCSAVVTAAQRIAVENPLISAQMVDARLYPEIVQKYNITRVPKTVINDQITLMGEQSIETLVQMLAGVKSL